MFVNFTNHHSDKWGERQLAEARRIGGMIVDEPFPQINPYYEEEQIAEIAEKYALLFAEKYGETETVVHVMGEMTFVYAFVNYAKELGLRCVASTTERQVVENEDGTKTAKFDFVQFREYSHKP